MTTAINRLNSTIKGEKTDRIPVFCNLLDQGTTLMGLDPKEYYSSGVHVAEAQLRLREKYGYDNVWSLFYVGKEAELLGCRNIIFDKYGPPNVGHMIIQKYEDIGKFNVPCDVYNHPLFEEQLKCLKILKNEVGGKIPICAYLTSSITLPAILMGMEKWVELLLCGPVDLRDELLEKCSDFFKKEIEAYRKGGADVLLYSIPFASVDFLPIKMIESIVIKWMLRDLQEGGTEGVVFYCGGARLNPTIDLVIENTGIKAYYLSPFDNVKEGTDIIAGRGLCAGVINDIRLIHMNKQEIKDEVSSIIAAGKPSGKFLFGTLVMPKEIPEENIKTMLEAAFEYGSHEYKN